jgi:deaminated glutathione amidase
VLIGVIQLTSTEDYKSNLSKIESYLESAKKSSCSIVFLPECFYCFGDSKAPPAHLVDSDNEHYKNIQSLASKYSVALIGGSAATKSPEGIKNRVYNFSKEGSDLGSYDKMNLFSCELVSDSGKVRKIKESDIYHPGDKQQLIDCQDIKIGLGVCFDLRFPDFAKYYRDQKASILTFSSAFTVPTGKAHWEVLLRARAIENQLFVIASAQVGKNNSQVTTYGHSMVIDPWGEVLLDMKEEEGISFVDIDLSMIEKVRKLVHCF